MLIAIPRFQFRTCGARSDLDWVLNNKNTNHPSLLSPCKVRCARAYSECKTKSPFDDLQTHTYDTLLDDHNTQLRGPLAHAYLLDTTVS